MLLISCWYSLLECDTEASLISWIILTEATKNVIHRVEMCFHTQGAHIERLLHPCQETILVNTLAQMSFWCATEF